MQNKQTANPEIGKLFGRLYSFNESLKLHHWQDTGPGSYARHMANDQALETVRDLLDRLVETSYSVYGDIDIVIPETSVPECLLSAVSDTYDMIEKAKGLFAQSFIQSILDEYQEALHQLNYRIARLQ